MTENPENVGKPPDGVLADQVLSSMVDRKDPNHDKALDTPSQAEPVDPNYTEPFTVEGFQEMSNILIKASVEKPSETILEQHALISYLLARIRILEAALLPFGMSALVMSNARMLLMSEGRGEEPAGGTWISKGSSGVQLQPNEGYFFSACDAVGRKRTNDHFASILKRIKEAQALQAEKNDHIEAGGKTH